MGNMDPVDRMKTRE